VVRLLRVSGSFGDAVGKERAPDLHIVTCITDPDDVRYIEPWRDVANKLVMSEPLFVREWGADAFHQRVLELETKGYIARLETYQITAETNPETGEIIHLHTMEMFDRSTSSPSES